MAKTTARLSIGILGALAYVVSFFCPAVYSGHNALPGWMCAWMTLGNILEIVQHPGDPSRALFALLGAANPLLVLYLCLLPFPKPDVRSTRRIVAITILALIPVATSCVIVMGLRIGIGHLLWVAGLGTIVGPGLSPEVAPS